MCSPPGCNLRSTALIYSRKPHRTSTAWIIRRPPQLGLLEFSCVSHISYLICYWGTGFKVEGGAHPFTSKARTFAYYTTCLFTYYLLYLLIYYIYWIHHKNILLINKIIISKQIINFLRVSHNFERTNRIFETNNSLS